MSTWGNENIRTGAREQQRVKSVYKIMKIVKAELIALFILMAVFGIQIISKNINWNNSNNNTLNAGIDNNKKDSEIIATGELGTCTWTIDNEGILIIKPTEGEEGTLAEISSSIWINYVDEIKKVNFVGTIHAGANLSYMFYNMKNITEINFNDFDTRATRNMNYMFRGCTSLKEIDISMFNTRNLAGGSSTSGGYRYSKINMFPKGMWKKGNSEYTNRALNLAYNTTIPGKWIKTSNIEYGLEISDIITYDVDLERKEYTINIKDNESIIRKDRQILFKFPETANAEDYLIEGSIELIYKNAATTVDGRVYDVKITIDNMHLFNFKKTATSKKKYLEILEIKNNSIPWLNDWHKNASFSSIDEGENVNYDVKIQIIDNSGTPQEGTFVFSAYDLDVDVTKAEFCEGINFKEGFYRDKIKISTKTRLYTNGFRTNPNVSIPRVYGSDSDQGTESSMVMAVVDAKGFKFTWTAGRACATAIISEYNPISVKFRKIDEQGNNLLGATLKLYIKKSGEELIRSWTTTAEDMVLFLNAGTYILRESAAPSDNYELAEDIVIYVESDGIIAVAGVGTVDDAVVKMKNYKKSAKVVENHYIMEKDGTRTEERVLLSNGGRPERDHIIRGGIGDIYETDVVDTADEYELVEIVGEASGEMTENTIYVIYYYRLKKYPYSVKYYDKDTLDEIKDPKTGIEEYYRAEVEVAPERVEEIEKYEYNSSDVGKTNKEDKESLAIGKHIEENVINLYYTKKKGTVITKYIDTNTGKEIEKEETTTDKIDEEYTTIKKEIEGYTFVESTDNTEGIYTVESSETPIEVIYYYEPIKYPYTVKYYDKDTKEEIKVAKEVVDKYYGDEVKVASERTEKIEKYEYDSSDIGETNKEDKESLTIGTNVKENVINLYYIKKKGTVITKYIDTNTGKEIEKEESTTDKIDEEYTTIKKEIEHYTFVVSTDNTEGVYSVESSETPIEVIYYYEPIKYPYTVKYYDKDTKEEIKVAKEVVDKYYGDEVKVASERTEKIEKYEYDSSDIGETNKEDKESLTIGTNVKENVINLYYIKKKGTVITKYIDINTGKEIADQETTTDRIDEKYTTIKKEIEGYTFVESTDNTEGLYTVESSNTPIEVIYFYKKNTKVTVNHIDKDTSELLDTLTEGGLVGDEYESTSKNFEGYILVEVPEEERVILAEEEIILNYYYSKVPEVIIDKESGGVIEKHIAEDTGKVLYNELHKGEIGDKYDIRSREFDGYKLVKEKLPTNNKGEMAKEVQEVIYYYIPKTFNLKVEKWVETASINGTSFRMQQYNSRDKISKLEIKESKIEDAEVILTYKIRITNSSEVEGYVEALSELIPEGYEFRQEDNKENWRRKEDVIVTNDLKETKIEPGKHKEIEIVLRWKNGETNFGEKTNIVTLAKVRNPYNYKDQTNEDNQYISKMVISLTTGMDRSDKIQITKISIYAVSGLMALAFIINRARKRK